VSKRLTLRELLDSLESDEVAGEVAIMAAWIETLAHKCEEKYGAKDFYTYLLREWLFKATVQPLIKAYELKGNVRLKPLLLKPSREGEG